MPSRTLPNFTRAEVESHNNEKSCFVLMGDHVYDVTDFLESHPGGEDYVLEYAGKDITEILKDQASHFHSEAAYDVLDESLVGFLVSEHKTNGKAITGLDGANDELTNGNGYANGNGKVNGNGVYVHPRTGMSCEDDLHKETDPTNDYKKHKFLDLSRPLFPQMWYGGFSKEFYLDQVHRPRHYKGGQSAPLFGNFLEPLSKTPWWVIPTLWWPMISYGVVQSYKFRTPDGYDGVRGEASYFLFGLFLWTLVEYILHRFLFHLDYYLPDNRVGLTAHFLLHGIHHYLPMDKYRLVMPPTLFLVLATPFWHLAQTVFYWDWSVATAVFCGGIFGYTCYDMTHYFLHHQNLPLYYKSLKKYHLEHHFLDYENGFGVTSKLWDVVFGTAIVSVPVVKTQ